MSPRGPDDVENRKFLTLPGFELGLLDFLCHPTHSQSLYRVCNVLWAHAHLSILAGERSWVRISGYGQF
jgi:hypothetical protein